uniref:V-type proton ATPase subunit G n=1 Tax=Oryctolagus cuniculus TaxID=9986 RepID=A0A5F9CCT4_RABIT|nr:V-type proton ATPase subunit G 1-like [Oryctolagus cuniculus]
MASQLQEIQWLLQAEKRVTEKVSESHKSKNQRLKQAKEAAQAEIEQYRRQTEKEFKSKEAVALGSHGSCSSEVEKETQEKMTILQTYFQQDRDKVLDNLLAFVCDIQPEIHENYRINGQKKAALVPRLGVLDALVEHEASAKLMLYPHDEALNYFCVFHRRTFTH